MTWSPATFAPGATVLSPNLANLVQLVVKRDDWNPGQHVGLVLDGAPSMPASWRCLRNFASGTPPRLRILYTWDEGRPEGDAAGH